MQWKFIYTVIYLAVLFLICPPIQAEEISDKIQTQYKEISSFKTSFVQKRYRKATDNTNTLKGDIVFQKPTSVRWHTREPEERLLLVNNSKVWQYIPGEKNAYKFSLQGKFKSKTMIEFITGEVNIKKDFEIEKLDKSEEGWRKLKLTPKQDDPNMLMAHLWVEPQTGLLRRIKIKDFWQNTNTLTFKDIELHPDISEDLFTFDPPKDVKVKDNS